MTQGAVLESAAKDFASCEIAVAGARFVADRSGALYWPDERTIVVADLHLEKGSAFAERGRMLPPYDTRETLASLTEAIARYDVEIVIALGDSLHDAGAAGRIGVEELEMIRNLQRSRQWIWVTGNHDPEIASTFGGVRSDAIENGTITLRHIPSPTIAIQGGEIAGHLHPAARLSLQGRTHRARCFATSRQRLILPALGAFAGGLNVLDTAFDGLFDRADMSVLMLGADGVYPVAPQRLCRD